MNILRVGDPHAKVGILDGEMKPLVLFIAQEAKRLRVDRIEILGDLFHTHNVIRLEVMEFWAWALNLLADICETVVLVGNHDQSGDYNSEFSALSIFALMKKENLHVIDRPTNLRPFGYIPYIHDHSKFIASARDLADGGCTVLVCHQTIEGSKYENGMHAPDGIPAGEWSERFIHVISGHIHSEQSFANVIYPGTARWDTVSDANRRKGIWLYTHSDGNRRLDGTGNGDSVRQDCGTILSNVFISTEKICSPIRFYEYREGTECPTWEPNARVAVELIGSSVWVTGQKELLKGKCSIKTKITDKQRGVIRKTGDSFENFMKDLFTSSVDKQELLKYAKEIGIV